MVNHYSLLRFALAGLCGLSVSGASMNNREYTFGAGESAITYQVDSARVAIMGLSGSDLGELLTYMSRSPQIGGVEILEAYQGTGLSQARLALQSPDYAAAFAAFVESAGARGGFVSPALVATDTGDQAYVMSSLLVGFPYLLPDDTRVAILDAIPGKSSVRLISSPLGVERVRLEQGLRPGEFFADSDLELEQAHADAGDFPPQIVTEPEHATEIYLIGLATPDGFVVLDQAMALAAQEDVRFAEPDWMLKGSTLDQEADKGRAIIPNLLFWDYNTEMLGDTDWLSDKVFGIFYGGSAPWYFHETHGWFYVAPVGHYDNFWFYDNASGSFYWTQLVPATYPNIMREDGVWFYYSIGSQNPRWFYNYAAETWETF